MDSLNKNNSELRIVLNQQLEIVEVSQTWLSILGCGCGQNEIVGKSINEFLSEKNPLKQENLDSFLHKEVEVEMISCHGSSLYFEITLKKAGDGFLLEGMDVTAFKKYQLRFHSLEHHAKAGFWERSWVGETTWTDGIYDMFDLPYTPMTKELADKVVECFSEESREILAESLERLFKEGIPYDIDLDTLTFAGKRKWLRTTGTGVKHNGKIIRGEGFIQDVTTYRENLRRLFESQEQLQFALAASDMGVWQANFKTGEHFWDKNMHKIYGIKPEQVPRSVDEFYKLVHPDDVERIHLEFNSHLQNYETLSTWFRIIVDEEVRYIATRVRRSSDDNLYIGVNWDITKEKLAEETIRLQEAKIISASRLSSLGEMAGRMAHEINNPLSVILARTSQLKRRSLKGELTQEELATGLSKIEETCNRIVTIINGLRTISRDGQRDPFERISLQVCLHNTLSLMTEKLRFNNVRLILDVSEEEIYVMGRLVQIEQVLMNLIHNSFDAISELPEREIKISLLKSGDKAEIRVSDSGEGVPDALVDRIFMPFFTTKEIGKGTGIGLSISKSIIEEHKGDFSFVRHPDDWYFSVALPLA